MTRPIVINGRELSAENVPYIIAEISANHNGSLRRAKETILAARDSGVDAVKIQTYTPDTMTIQSEGKDFWIHEGLWKGRALYDLYAEAHTPFEWQHELFDYALQVGVTLFSSPFDETAVDLLQSLQTPAYKVASFELVDLPLIAYIAQKKKPMLLSTGMASFEEIGRALDVARKAGCTDIGIFHCISGYPTPLDQANVRLMNVLRDTFDVEVGLSDHTLGPVASIAATALGAAFIEKHFTLSRADGGVDSAFSLEPAEMKDLVTQCHATFKALGRGSAERSDVEVGNKTFRRSLYFVEDLMKGDVITERHVKRIRPGFGLSPEYYNQVIGSRAKRAVRKGDRVVLADACDP